MTSLRFVIVALTLSFFSALSSIQAQERIVSLGGDVTEIIYALGEGDRIAATDTTSVYPLRALATKKVGYVRQLSAEGVLSVEPDLILISGAAGPETALEQLRGVGVEIIEMETAYTIDSIIEKTRIVAETLGVEAKGEELVAEIEANWAEASARIEALDIAPTALFFSTVGDGNAMAAGTDTAAHGLIELLGGENIFAGRTGYKPISLEAAVAADPEIILVMSHNIARAGGMDKMISHPSISLTTAAQTGKVFVVDTVRVMQFSPRTPIAIAELAEEIEAALNTNAEG
ncbi:MAG: ABC transporter substrate-binding protein [Pseudomonadota bacterium]